MHSVNQIFESRSRFIETEVFDENRPEDKLNYTYGAKCKCKQKECVLSNSRIL